MLTILASSHMLISLAARQVLAIYGMAGSGKSTLAKTLFRKLQPRFVQSGYVAADYDSRVSVEVLQGQLLRALRLRYWQLHLARVIRKPLPDIMTHPD